MSNTSRARCLAWLVLMTTLTLTGCKQKPERLIAGSYSPSAHLQYQEDAAQEQIEALESDVEDIKAQGGVVPPGYYAQIGLLYFNLGKTEQMRQRLTADQDPFPDSTAEMNELMKHAKATRHPEPVDPPNPLIETTARTDFSLERFSSGRAFLRSDAQPLIF